MTRRLFAAALLLLPPVCGFAQNAEAPAIVPMPEAVKAPSLKVPTIVFAGAAAADWASTYASLSTGHTHEVNPQIAWAKTPAKTVIAGAAMDIAGVWAVKHFAGRKHHKAVVIGLYAASAFRVYLVTRNVRAYRAAGR